MKKQNVRTLSLVVTTFTYLLIGAAVFDSLELSNDEKRIEALKEIQYDIQAKYNISKTDFDWIEQMVIENKPHRAGPQWKFAGSLFFATVVLAPIGYGHSTPNTAAGKAFCMLYAVIGIPLGIVMFQSIGERLNKGASIIISHLKKWAKCKDIEASEMNMMMTTGMLSTVIITGGAAIFSKCEGWTYFDSFYYLFITLTTVGFGDYVALQQDHTLEKSPGYVVFTVVFILFGLAVVASSINILVLRFMTMQMEEMQREDTELGPASENVITFLNKDEIMDPTIERNDANLYYQQDQLSVCSCTCYPRYVDLQQLYQRKSKTKRIYQDPDTGTNIEITSIDEEVPAIITKRASV